MSYYPDLSGYLYTDTIPPAGPRVLNIGWLDHVHGFPTEIANDGVLESVWRHCLVAVLPTRGLHSCPLCSSPAANLAERGGVSLLLGSAEIRVLGNGVVYACPDLVYHYMAAHDYAPPTAFLDALAAGPVPPEPDYFARLKALGVEWQDARRVGAPRERFRFVKTERGVERVLEPPEIPGPTNKPR